MDCYQVYLLDFKAKVMLVLCSQLLGGQKISYCRFKCKKQGIVVKWVVYAVYTIHLFTSNCKTDLVTAGVLTCDCLAGSCHNELAKYFNWTGVLMASSCLLQLTVAAICKLTQLAMSLVFWVGSSETSGVLVFKPLAQEFWTWTGQG